jgi:hypothetical protein
MRRRSGGAAGTSVVETVMVLALFGVVAAALLAAGDALTRNAAHQDAIVEVQEEVRAALARLTRDLRGAAALEPPSVGAAADTLDVEDPTGAVVRWRLVGTALVRSVLGPDGDAVRTEPVLAGVDNAAAGVAPFRYFDGDGVELDATRPAGDISRCTVRVEATIVARVRGASFTERNAANLRSRLGGPPPC